MRCQLRRQLASAQETYAKVQSQVATMDTKMKKYRWNLVKLAMLKSKSKALHKEMRFAKNDIKIFKDLLKMPVISKEALYESVHTG